MNGKIKSFYSFAKLLSFNSVYNMSVGGRGIGKTYGAKKKVTKDAIKTSYVNKEYTPEVCDQFIYVRRYKEELQLAKSTFFADYNHEFPDWDFRVQGIEAQMAHVSTRDTKKRKWDTIGYFVALSTAQSWKSVSFPRVKWVIFDEFILEKSATHYLPNEATIFNNFFSTVDRYKDKTRVMFLANAVSIDNPYFIEYRISPDDIDANGFVLAHNKFVATHFIDSDDFKNEVYSTKFGQFIQGTAYADYAVGNIFFDNHKQLIEDKNSRAKYMYTLETSDATFSVWLDMMTGMYYCQSKRPKNEVIITIVPSRMDDNKTLMNFNDKTLAMLRTAFRHARVAFDAPPTRNAFLEIFKR